jgi:Skp family chaperone for outer membrane proteins
MTGTRRPFLAPLAVALLLSPASLPVPGHAQETPPPFLLLNQERILTGSRAGQAILAEEEAARDALRAEAREIDSRFEAEERRLTALRGEVEPEEFRALADAFDEEVIRARREQDERATAVALEFEQRRRQFYAEVAPLLVGILSRYEAHAIFDESAVLLADQSLNITDAVIAEIDAAMPPPDAPPPDAPPPDQPPDPAEAHPPEDPAPAPPEE